MSSCRAQKMTLIPARQCKKCDLLFSLVLFIAFLLFSAFLCTCLVPANSTNTGEAAVIQQMRRDATCRNMPPFLKLQPIFVSFLRSISESESSGNSESVNPEIRETLGRQFQSPRQRVSSSLFQKERKFGL